MLDDEDASSLWSVINSVSVITGINWFIVISKSWADAVALILIPSLCLFTSYLLKSLLYTAA